MRKKMTALCISALMLCSFSACGGNGSAGGSTADPALEIPDFIVEVPEGRNPVVLQLTDTQIIDAGQARPGRGGVDDVFWATDQVEERCYEFIYETVAATQPDLIIMTGDNVYGEFDDNGSVMLGLVNFMESLQIPWAPIFGNHDNESAMGVDWQCQQFENAQFCLFEQKELTGNGNYSVGISQGGKLKRVFYMLDSNGCGNPSEKTLENSHFTRNSGFGMDQIQWYTDQINAIKEVSPDVKISFAYHIQQAIFQDAYSMYGFPSADIHTNPIHIDAHSKRQEGDFGVIASNFDSWDKGNALWGEMKALGVDSVFVGHEHCISARVVYDGVRFQYGQKSSEYDQFLSVVDGKFVPTNTKKGTSLIGGSVIPLSEEDGSIVDPYIYYCREAGGKIDWSQWE